MRCIIYSTTDNRCAINRLAGTALTIVREGDERAVEATTLDAPLEARQSFFKSTFASLSEREYAWYFSGNLAFFMAMQMQFILFGFLTFDLTGSAKALGVVAA